MVMNNTKKTSPPTAPPVKKAPPPPPPPPVAELATLDAVLAAAVTLSDEDKRDLLAGVMDTMVTEEPTVEDVKDLAVDAESSWRTEEPEVFAVALVARVVGRSISVNDLETELLGYLAGHTPARQGVLRSRLRLALSTAVGVGQKAGSYLS